MKKLLVVLIICCLVFSAFSSFCAIASSQVEQIIAAGKSILGSQQYNGYCQSFVKWCYQQAGIYASQNASYALQAWEWWGISTSRENIPIGACVYFDSATSPQYGHVGIYLGNNQFIHAVSHASDGENGVKISSFSSYWNKYYKGWGWQAGIEPSSSSGLTTNHTCSGGKYLWYWDAHPHYNCYKCATCGEEWANKNETNYIASCSECNPKVEESKPKYFTITYNANGGSGAPSSETIPDYDGVNEYIEISSKELSRNGYTFLGWSTNSSASSADYEGGDRYRITENTTFYAVWQKEPEIDYSCGSNLRWEYDDWSSTLTISGSGYMYDFDGDKRPWEHIKDEVEIIEIEDGIKDIGIEAFKDFENLEEVILPNSVKKIGEDAFENCSYFSVEYNGTSDEFDNIDIDSGNSSFDDDIEFQYVTVHFSNLKSNTISDQIIASGDCAKKPRTPSASNYRFVGWYYDGAEFNFNTKIRKDITIKAKWESASVTVYAPDGRTMEINESDKNAYKKVGWYTYPVRIMYSIDGRTVVVAKSQETAYNQVGWYYKPVTVMYALGGKTAVVEQDKEKEYSRQGWYYKPVTKMYALDGRTIIVEQDQERAYSAVGWYYQPVTKLYAYDGRSIIVETSQVDKYLNWGWYR